MSAILALGGVLGAAFAAAPAAAADKIAIEVGGEYTQYFGYADNDITTGDFSGFDVKADGGLTFGGKTVLDTGLEAGVEVTLKTESTDDQIDGSFLYLENRLGRLELGSRDNVAALMHYSAPDVGFGVNDSDIADWAINPSGGDTDSAFQSTYLYLGEDQSNKVNYFTPRFEGVQFGVSFIPEFEQDSNTQPDKDLYHNGFAFGANYARAFGGAELALAAGYLTTDRPDRSGAGIESAEGYSLGAILSYAGFTIGGSFADTQGNGGAGTDADVSFNGSGYDIGVAYAFGDASVSLSYYRGEVEDGPAAGDSTHETLMASGSYELGPGVTVLGSVFRTEFEADTGSDNTAWVGLTGITLEF